MSDLRKLKRQRLAIRVVASLALAWGVSSLAWDAYRDDAGEPSEDLEDHWHQSHRIVDRHGVLLRELPAEAGRSGRPVAIEAVGDRILAATLAAEDESFFDHDGVDRVAIARATEQNVRHRRLVSGASTITQQLVKLLDTRGVPGARTPAVKIREAARAQNLEEELSKEEILEAYLNRLPYGNGLVGPQSAASAYFGVDNTELSWAQAAYLSVLPRAPSYLDPYRHSDRVVVRQHAVLDALEDSGTIDAAACERAKNEAIELRPLEHPFAAPHFTQTLLAEERLAGNQSTQTTIDAQLQHDAAGLVTTHLADIAEFGATNAAAIVIDNESGDVLAWVGSADFEDVEISGQVDMVRSLRQPGSALKPFVYALAFEDGLTGPQMVADVPTQFTEGGNVYAPGNFDRGFVGPISAREALASSLNVPAVRLAAELEPGRLLGTLRDLGMNSLDEAAHHYGLSLALGSGEVELRELAAAYVALARGGESIDLRYTTADEPSEPARVIEPAIAAAVTEALSDPLARTRLLHGRSPFDIGYPIALKTGTSSGFRDAWTAGFTHERTVVVWVGNADGSGMRNVTGASGAGPLFADIMRRAMEDVPTRIPLWNASLLHHVQVCPLSGLPAGPDCPDRVMRNVPGDHVHDSTCGVHVRVRGREAMTCDPDGDQVVAGLPRAFEEWLAEIPDGAPGKDPYGTPWVPASTLLECGADLGERPTLTMVTPFDGALFMHGEDSSLDRVPLRARFDGPSPAAPERIEFVVDGKVVAQSEAPYKALVALGPGDHEVYARPVDKDAEVAMNGTAFSVR